MELKIILESSSLFTGKSYSFLIPIFMISIFQCLAFPHVFFFFLSFFLSFTVVIPSWDIDFYFLDILE
jgi:hypothetical protein